MHVDDRLATVLHHRAAGERAARVQFRQLLDLLGQPHPTADQGLMRAAFRRLDALGLMIPLAQRERLAAECSPRIRNPALLAWLAGAEPQLALAALSRAAIDEEQWLALIPELPIRARGLLRHRRNFSPAIQSLLDRLGVRDRVLPEPEPEPAGPEPVSEDVPAALAPPPPLPALDLGTSPEEIYVLETGHSVDSDDDLSGSTAAGGSDLAALVQRIEAFQQARARRQTIAFEDPQLPLGADPPADQPRARLESFIFTTDDSGRIDWAEQDAALLVTGTLLTALGSPRGGERNAFAAAFARRRPVIGADISLGGGQAAAGVWVIDAAPRFVPRSGAFTGYVGRCRRPAPAADTRAARAADRIRQLLHELRTPVTAIQGFAEVIQQQTVGAVPHEYRALAAEIAGDAARMLAGFAELERLARLEAGTQEMPEGTSDFATIARRQVAQLQTVLSPRVSRLEAEWRLREARVAIAPEAGEMLAWRFLGTLASATAAGERIAIELTGEDNTLRLLATLPATLAQAEDVFASDLRASGGMPGTGLFGAGFTLRLARGEARAAGGDLRRDTPGSMLLTLPLSDAISAPENAPERTAERAGS